MQIYLVGGAVRDELLGRPVVDRDWVVVGATSQQMLELGFSQVGKDFPVFLHPETREEYALARTERKAGRGYTGFVCDASPGVTLEQDLMRRDLTINAMAKDQAGNLIDPYGGRADLENRILRHVSEAFSEDPLRVFRVARFAARLADTGFTVAPPTQALMQQMAASGELAALTAERVWQETRRALMEDAPQVYFQVLADASAWQDWFAELPPQEPQRDHRLQLAVRQQLGEQQRFALLCSELDSEPLNRFCQRLKAPNSFVELAALCARESTGWPQEPGAETQLTLFDNCDAWRKPERFEALLKALEVVSQANGVKPADAEAITAQLLATLDRARQVDVQKILAEGHKGPAIKSAIREARLSAIRQMLYT